MKQKLFIFFALMPSYFLCSVASAHVCDSLKQVQGFSSATLFNQAIINGKPLDYYSFVSTCDIVCLTRYLKEKRIQYRLENNLSVFDSKSIGTISIEKRYSGYVSGYLTCSTDEYRKYITNPFRYDVSKISLDLQTEDHINVTRTLNFQNTSKASYLSLIKQVESLSSTKSRAVGFYYYTLKSGYGVNGVKISDRTPRGDFMMIIEKRK